MPHNHSYAIIKSERFQIEEIPRNKLGPRVPQAISTFERLVDRTMDDWGELADRQIGGQSRHK
jgi:hypothetical protein